jgi:hypothetical protein
MKSGQNLIAWAKYQVAQVSDRETALVIRHASVSGRKM